MSCATLYVRTSFNTVYPQKPVPNVQFMAAASSVTLNPTDGPESGLRSLHYPVASILPIPRYSMRRHWHPYCSLWLEDGAVHTSSPAMAEQLCSLAIVPYVVCFPMSADMHSSRAASCYSHVHPEAKAWSDHMKVPNTNAAATSRCRLAQHVINTRGGAVERASNSLPLFERSGFERLPEASAWLCLSHTSATCSPKPN